VEQPSIMNKLYFIKIDEDIDEHTFNFLLLLTSYEKQQKINNFRFDIDKKLSLFSDILVRYLACKSLNLANKDLHFAISEYSKPYLIGYRDFQYNISHTRSAIVVGVSNLTIGVDIEKIRKSHLKIAKKFFTYNEFDYILTESGNQDKLFYEIWTKKEAFIKWIGKGLSIPLISFDVTSEELKDKISTYQIDDYIISICSIIESNESNLIEMSEQELIGKVMNLLPKNII
jgi:4'-phosphopantetheinyl transferase